MTVRKIDLSAGSDLHCFVKAGDFLDCYSVEIDRDDFIISDIAQRIFIGAPRWVQLLLKIRDLGVAPFGLKTTARLPRDDRYRSSVQAGEAISFFCVHSVTENEIILGEDDKHLDFRISVFREADAPRRVSLATWVRTHNRLGRAYLRLIMRFHVFIVRTRLAALPGELA